MSFQAYLDNIKAKTGKGPEDFKKLADKKGFTSKGKLKEGVKAGETVQWLKDDFELGTDMQWPFMPCSKAKNNFIYAHHAVLRTSYF